MKKREREGGMEFVYKAEVGGGRNGRLISNGSNPSLEGKESDNKTGIALDK
jgi:hypothetical protein